MKSPVITRSSTDLQKSRNMDKIKGMKPEEELIQLRAENQRLRE
jgi:hypothetical protein